MKIIGVILACGCSKGVPGKNIRLLAGRPLIAYTIELGMQCSLITDVVLTTEDEKIREIAIDCGAQAPFLRPSELATDTALAVPTVQHAVREMEKVKGGSYDYVIMLQPTSPLKTTDDLTNALQQLIKSDADSIISVVDVDNWHPMKMKKFEEGLLVDYDEPPVEMPPRQSLPSVYIVNGAIYATKRDVLMERNSFKGSKCLGYIMPFERSVNIDTEADFLVAEYYINKR